MRRAVVLLLPLGVVASWNRLHAQCPDGSPPPCAARPPAARAAPAERTPSLSVLYLANTSPDTVDAALADGLTEELITRLSGVDGLRVTSRYAALRYRGRRALDPRQVGRELGVRYVLQGTLRRSEARVRVSVEITEAATGYNVWGQRYDQPLSDVFALQDSVAVQVVEAVRGRLTGGERARLTPPARARNPEAYEAYLRGRAAIRERTASSAEHALAQFRRAVALDPGFAAAHAALAHAYALAALWGWDLPDIAPAQVRALASQAAAQALALDSASADSWLAAAMAARFTERRRALEYNRRAVTLDSTSIEALHQLAWGFLAVGQLDSAIVTEQRVTARDPFYTYAYAGLGQILMYADRPLEALALAAQGAAIDSAHALPYFIMADANLRLGRPNEARAAAERGLALGAPAASMRIFLALARLKAGDSAAGRAELQAVAQELGRELASSPEGLADEKAALLSGAYAQVGEPDSAIAWARRVAPWDADVPAAVFARHWLWEPVRGDPRFQALLAELRP